MKKIRFEDISVGDWIEAGDNVKLRVKYPRDRHDMITVEYLEPVVIQAITVTETTIRIEDARPIPITPEILKQIGCEQIWKYRGNLKFNHEVFFADKRSDGGWNIVGNMCSIRATYLHELQHALRLAGVEKEIEL